MLKLAPSQANRARAELRRRGKRSADVTTGEWAKCSADLAYFLDTYGVIDDSDDSGTVTGTMPFKLWSDPSPTGYPLEYTQRDVATILQHERRAIVLKARQLGLTWVVCGLALWLCLTRAGQVVLALSKGQIEADEILRRVRVLYERLPEGMKATAPARVKDNASLQAWSNGSWIRSLPATPGTGRSFAGSLLILDEAAHMMWGKQVYGAAKPTIDTGNRRLIVLSTANGLDWFRNLWADAVAGANGFRTVFLPWWARPDRDQAWHDRVVAESVDPYIIPQEYAADPTTCFLSSGRTRFPAPWIAQQAPNVRPPLDRRDWPEALRAILYDDGLSVYAGPAFGRRYLIGADVAEGLETGDYSAAVVLDAETHEEMASLHGRWEPDEFAGRLHGLAAAYAEHGAEESVLIVERNNHGHAVLSKLRSLNDDEDGPAVEIADGPDGRSGWVTSAKTKPEAIDALAVLLRDGRLAVRSQATLDEMQVYRRDPNGGTSAPPSMHDDRVMAWAVAVGWQEIAETGPSVVASNPLSSYRGLTAGPGYRR